MAEPEIGDVINDVTADISTIVKAAVKDGKPQAGGDKAVKYDQEGTGLGFKTDARLESFVVAQPTSCQMKRPPKP